MVYYFIIRFAEPGYFGVLSSNSKHRDKLVPHNNSEAVPIKRKNKSYINWADLLKRTFKIDILKCETCGNNMQLISVVEDFFLPIRLPHNMIFLSFFMTQKLCKNTLNAH